MLSSGFSVSRESFLKIKMEEQTVPSAGFSPQPEYMTGGGVETSTYYGNSGNGMSHLQPTQPQHQMHPHHHLPPTSATLGGNGGGNGNACYDYNTSFDTFDLSLLGDSYEDRDMATVPSPSASCWSPLGAMEPTAWQQSSFYANSPPEFRAFSPDCKPFAAPDIQQSSNSNAGSPSPPQQQQQQQILDNANAAASPSLSNNSSNGDANLAHHQHLHGNSSATDILLRQCLEDNTFIEKYNFKPLDLPINALPPSNDAVGVADTNMEGNNSGARIPSGATGAVGNATLDMNLEPVFNLAYETIISDIQNQCRTLGISPDPMQWSVENVHSWLSYSLTSFTSSEKRSGPSDTSFSQSASSSLWNINGQQLCSLSEEEFRQRDPLNGVKIYANLELLKMWKCNTAATSAVQPFDFGQLLNSCSPASGAASPAPSFGDEQQQHHHQSSGAGIVVKVEFDENMQTTSSAAKFSNPSSVDTSASSSASSIRNSDDDDEDDDEDDKSMSGGTSSAATAAAAIVTGTTKKACGTKNGAHIHLWQFLKELLASGQQHGSCIRWLDQSRGVFKIEDSVRVARLWGIRKNRPAMNYDKLSRSIRQYYRKGIMRKTERSQRLVYQFCHPYGL